MRVLCRLVDLIETTIKTFQLRSECLLSGIHEVWATGGRTKSPPCEVSDRLLATREKVQNNIGGNTGPELRLWNTWINAIIGLNMDDMWRQPASQWS